MARSGMPFELSKVAPWGRSFDEYVAMFSLSDEDLQKKILGVGDGPASFNAELNARGGRVVSVDPIYETDGRAIERRIAQVYDDVMEQMQKNAADYVWKNIGSVDELGRVRLEAMKRFLEDYEAGLTDGRYVAAELPDLPFQDGSFDLAVCSHFLFLYERHLGLDLHEQALLELCRVADEVRVFPLLALDGSPSKLVEPLRKLLAGNGLDTEIKQVPYEFQRGGNKMLVVRVD